MNGTNPTDPLLEWLSSAGTLGVLAFGVIAFVRGWIVTGSAHMRVIAERDRCFDLLYAEDARAKARIAELSRQLREAEAEIIRIERENRAG